MGTFQGTTASKGENESPTTDNPDQEARKLMDFKAHLTLPQHTEMMDTAVAILAVSTAEPSLMLSY